MERRRYAKEKEGKETGEWWNKVGMTLREERNREMEGGEAGRRRGKRKNGGMKNMERWRNGDMEEKCGGGGARAAHQPMKVKTGNFLCWETSPKFDQQ